MEPSVIAEGDRVYLRSTTEEELELVLKLERAPENSPYVRQWPIEKHRQAVHDDNIGHWLICTKSDNKVVGYTIVVGLQDADDSFEFKRIVIDTKGGGIGRECVHLIVKYAFEQVGAHRVWCETVEHNERAFKLIQSEGFKYEGLHRESLKKEDKYINMKVLSMLADEYKNRQTEK
jgi:diamine N-acetyltransferase